MAMNNPILQLVEHTEAGATNFFLCITTQFSTTDYYATTYTLPTDLTINPIALVVKVAKTGPALRMPHVVKHVIPVEASVFATDRTVQITVKEDTNSLGSNTVVTQQEVETRVRPISFN